MNLPKWAQNAVTVKELIHLDTVGELLQDLIGCPGGAYVESNEYNELTIVYYRDMTKAEFQKETAKRRKQKQDAKESDLATLTRLAKKHGVELA